MNIEHTLKLAKQGPLLNLAIKEGQDLTWKSFAFNRNKGALKCILNSTLDTLPTKANLLQWKKTTSDKCCLCNGRQTTVHVLSACPVFLNQGRLTWRHDGIVKYIAECVDTDKYQVYADVHGHQTPDGGTIPADVLVTGDRPDVVIYDKKKMTMNVFELTVPYKHNVDKRHIDKSNNVRKFKPVIEALEVERGYISSENKKRLKTIHSFCKKETTAKQFVENIAKLAI